MSFISGINLNPNNSFFENSSGNKCDTALEVDRSHGLQKGIKSPWNTLYQLFRAQGLLDEDALISDLLKNFAWGALPLEKTRLIENFWNQAKRHLRKFNGIPRETFGLFLKECEWRFNNSEPKSQLKQLKQWAKEFLN